MISLRATRTLLARRSPLLRTPQPVLTRTYASSASSSSRPLANVAVYALGAVGVASLAYAGYDAFTDWRDMFPEEVRIPLKRGIAAKLAGSAEESIAYKREAWSIARSLPTSSFKPPDSYLKLTGIAIDLAGELEEVGDVTGAYALYTEALDRIREPSLDSAPPSQHERLRAVEMAVKLGWMVEEARDEAAKNPQHPPKLSVTREDEETLRVWAAEEVMRLVMEVQREKTGKIVEAVEWSTLQLPEWLSKTSVCVPLVKLAEFYAGTGKMEYAMPLFVQAASLLVGDTSASVPRADLCAAARVFNTVATLIMHTQPTPEGRDASESWTARSLAVLKIAQGKVTPGHPAIEDAACESALAVALINGGMLREVVGDYKKSKELLNAALNQGKALGMTEGIQEIQQAINRIEAKEAKAVGAKSA